MPSERRFRDDGTKATWFYKPDDGDDRMKENDEDVVHAGIVSKSQKIPEFRPILEFATDRIPENASARFGRSVAWNGPDVCRNRNGELRERGVSPLPTIW